MTAIRIVEIQDINVETNFSQKGSINNAATSPPDTIEESTILHIVNLFHYEIDKCLPVSPVSCETT